MSKSKAKGTAAETAVVRYLRSLERNGTPVFPDVERRALSGNVDKGDIAGIPFWTIEVKAAKTLKLSEWKNETVIEATNAGTTSFMLVVKRPYKPVAEWDAYMPAWILNQAWLLGEDTWVRMDLALAAAFMALSL